jgi:hypothetical protein
MIKQLLFVLFSLSLMQAYGGLMGPSYNSVSITRSNTHGLAAAIKVGGGPVGCTAPSDCAGEPTHRDENI